MTPDTRRIIAHAHRDMREFVRKLAAPESLTSTEIEEMVSALEDIAVELDGVLEDIKVDEERLAAE